MVKPSMFEAVKISLYKAYGKNPEKMLIHTGVIGWAMSSLAQICAILLNDKIPKEQKMFMVPQEFADAAINIASFYLVTRTFATLTSKAVQCGKLLPKDIKDYFRSTLAQRIPKKIRKFGKPDFKVEKYLNQLPKPLKKEYKSFKNGVDVLATIVGSVISCNIITPLLRNLYASHRQKENIARMNNPKPQVTNSKLAKINPLAGRDIYSFNRRDLKI